MFNLNIEMLLDQHADVAKDLAGYDPVLTASVFGGLLTDPGLQSNCIRLESLAHLSFLSCKGRKKPPRKVIRRAYKRLGEGLCGMMEDPAEDVFVSLVTTPSGSFRIFEGVWEAAAYYLQRVLNVVEGMPDTGSFLNLKRSVEALLRLSEAIAERVQVERYSLGNECKVAALPLKSFRSTEELGKLVTFSMSELAALGVDTYYLTPFYFSSAGLEKLFSEDVGNSTLERCPLAWRNDCVHVVLPSAIPSTIRRFAFEFVKALGQHEVFEAALAREYKVHLGRQRILGTSQRVPVDFIPWDGGWTSSVVVEIDSGRYLHLEFVMDSLTGFEDEGFLGFNTSLGPIEEAIEIRMKKAIESVSSDPNYKGGLTLVVSCGYGRGFAFGGFDSPDPNWRIEVTGAATLQILGWTEEFSPLALWRILEERDKLSLLNVHLLNANGLLNLIAWVKQNDGHLIPHDQMPRGAGTAESPLQMIIDQNALRNMRHDFYTMWDPHRELSPEGEQVLLFKEEPGAFDDDNKRPLYVDIDSAMSGEMRGVYKTPNRSWWFGIKASEDADSGVYFQHYELLREWMARAVPVLEERVVGLPFGPISWTTTFESFGENENHEKPKPHRDNLLDFITVSVNSEERAVHLEVAASFMGAFRYPDNIAERTLVRALVAGAIALSEEKGEEAKCEELTGIIVPDQYARQVHYFNARFFRDFVSDLLPSRQIVISKNDDAATSLGLGWRVRSRDAGNDIRGKKNCTTFINELVQDVESEICSIIKGYNRNELVSALIVNIEKLVSDRDRWRRTARAVLSMHGESESVFATISEHLSRLSGASLASRILVEIAICEAPLTGGMVPGQIDLSQLMALAMTIFHLGGWSNAIHRDAMEPRVFITPLGDVQVNHNFIDSVMAPFGRAGNDVRVKDDATKYEKNYKPASFSTSVEDSFENDFLQAWEDEFGASVDEVRMFMDAIEDWAIRERKLLVICKKSELVSQVLKERALDAGVVKNILDAFILFPRTSWKDVPEGYWDADRQPWRFRRRLSFIRRPIVQIDNQNDPTLMFSPGFVRDSVVYVIGNFYDGNFPERQAKAKSMRRWIGQASNKRGTAFNSEVADRLRELGWETDSDVNVTHLLGKGFERNYGDVDVLAWNQSTGIVLLIECKDLQYHKTLGEVAEQVSDFRGEIKPNGKPDLLKKHLDRLDLIEQHPVEVAAFTGLTSSPDIQGLLVFRNPVPMQFAWEEMKSRLPICLFEDLDKI